MKSPVKKILLITIPIILIALMIIIRIVVTRASKIPENPLTAAGNLAGNLYNGGYFAESNGKIYFANPYDNYNLYVMNPDQSEQIKLITGNISQINILGNYIYYYSASSGDQSGLGYVLKGKGIYRSTLDGQTVVSLIKCSSDSVFAAGNRIYFTNFSDTAKNGNAIITLDAISTEGENPISLCENHVKLGAFSGTEIFFAGMNGDHYLYSLDNSLTNVQKISSESMYLPVIYENEVYFLDLNDEYKLKAMSLADSSVRIVVDERIDTYNLYNGIIYYQNCVPNEYALKRCNADGSNIEIVQYGVFNNINITSTYVYFTEFNNELPLYYTSTNGPVNIQTFQ